MQTCSKFFCAALKPNLIGDAVTARKRNTEQQLNDEKWLEYVNRNQRYMPMGRYHNLIVPFSQFLRLCLSFKNAKTHVSAVFLSVLAEIDDVLLLSQNEYIWFARLRLR